MLLFRRKLDSNEAEPEEEVQHDGHEDQDLALDEQLHKIAGLAGEAGPEHRDHHADHEHGADHLASQLNGETSQPVLSGFI